MITPDLGQTNSFECGSVPQRGGAKWTRSALLLPLLALSASAAVAAAVGIRHALFESSPGSPTWPVEFIISAALHATLLICIAAGRARFLTIVCWLVSTHFCVAGLSRLASAESALGSALLLELMCLLLAAALRPSMPLAERLAVWRRSRRDIMLQLKMSDGLISWVSPALIRFFSGTAELPEGTWHRRFLAQLADAELALRTQIESLALPEQLRQSMITSACALAQNAELSAGKLALELEQCALNAAALLKEQCLDQTDMSMAQKQDLADQCAALFLTLAHPAPLFSADVNRTPL